MELSVFNERFEIEEFDRYSYWINNFIPENVGSIIRHKRKTDTPKVQISGSKVVGTIQRIILPAVQVSLDLHWEIYCAIFNGWQLSFIKVHGSSPSPNNAADSCTATCDWLNDLVHRHCDVMIWTSKIKTWCSFRFRLINCDIKTQSKCDRSYANWIVATDFQRCFFSIKVSFFCK